MEHSAEILIAEDGSTQAARLEHLLKETGCAVRMARDGRRALAMARERKPEVLISDVVLTGMDGYALCDTIKSDPNLRDISVVLMTSISGAEEVLHALRCGADNLIRKPFEQNRLLELLPHILANRELHRSGKMPLGAEIDLAGHRHSINSEKQQIRDLLLSAFMDAVHLNRELREHRRERALSNEQVEAKVPEQTAFLTEVRLHG